MPIVLSPRCLTVTQKNIMSHSRVFNNNSSADIIVAEVGIIGKFQIGEAQYTTPLFAAMF